MPQVFVALGANLAEPKAQLDQACAALQALDSVSSFQVSPYYTSAPMAGSALIDDQIQPEYVNAVCAFYTTLAPLALLDQLQAIENEQGRIRAQRWGARTLDLDLLLYGQQTIEQPRLTVPHYGMKQRAFVLVPLADLAPELILPCGTPLAQFINTDLRAELRPY